MSKSTNGFQLIACMRMAGVLLLCALSIILIASALLTFCIQNEYIDITSVGIIKVIIHAVAGLVSGSVLFAGRKEHNIWNILSSLFVFILIGIALNCLIYDTVTMEWGWGIVSMFGGIFVTYMVQNRRKVRSQKAHTKYRTR